MAEDGDSQLKTVVGWMGHNQAAWLDYPAPTNVKEGRLYHHHHHHLKCKIQKACGEGLGWLARSRVSCVISSGARRRTRGVCSE